MKNINYKRYISTINVFLWLAFASLIFFIINRAFLANDYTVTKHVKYENINYDSSSRDPSLVQVKSYSEKDASDIKEINIRFKMRVAKIENYNNVFQTAPYNMGVRMELSPPSKLSLCISDGTEAGLKGFFISDIQVNKWYFVDISISKGKGIKVFVDNKIALNKKDSDINYAISDIAIGTGFGKSRPFYGEITDFSIDYKLLKGGRLIKLFYILFSSIILMIVLYFTFKNLRIEGNKNIFLSVNAETTLKEATIIEFIIIAGLMVSMFFHYMNISCDMHYHYSTFLFRSDDRFNDFFNAIRYTHGFSPFTDLVEPFYFPFAYLVTYIFSLIKPAFLSHRIYLLIFSATVFWWNYSSVKKLEALDRLKYAFILSFMIYPFLFSIDRSNFECILFIFLCFFIYFYIKGNMLLSILFLSFATAMKLYPALFILIYISDKKYREAFYLILLTFALSFFALKMMTTEFQHNIRSGLNGLQSLYLIYGIKDAGLRFGESLFGMGKVFLYTFFNKEFLGNTFLIAKYYKIYLIFTMINLAVITLYITFIEKELWRKVTIIVLAIIVFPYQSGAYKLIHLLIPLALYLGYSKGTSKNYGYLILFGILMIPKDYYHFAWNPDISISAVIDPLIMYTMLAMTIIINTRKYLIAAK